MPQFLQDLISQLKNIWIQLTGAQRLVVGVVLMAVIVGMGSLIYFGTRPDYVPFRNDLLGEERAKAIRLLEDAGVQIRLQGDVLLVDSRDKSKAGAAMAKAGLGKGSDDSTSLNALDSVTMSRDMTREMMRRVRAKEVEKAIQANRSVVWAKVIYNNPRRSFFVSKELSAQPSASVIISLRRPEVFKSVARQAIEITTKSLGIDRSMVTVNSTDGHSFSEGDVGSGGASSDLLSLEMKHSSILTAKAQMALERLYPGKTQVSASVTYANTITSLKETIVPEDKVLKEKTTTKSNSINRPKTAGGDPGVGSIAGGSAGQGAVEAGANTQEESRSHEIYQSNLGTRIIRPLAPEVKKLTISLAIDKSLEKDKSQIVNLVMGAVGWDAKRDGAITPAVMEFPKDEAEAAPESGMLDMVKQYGPLGAQILSILFVLLFLRGLLKKGKKASGLAAGVSSSGGASGPNEDEELNPAQQIKKLRREIEKVVAEDPGSVSRLMENWLREKADAS
jgi:flagellar biosynthesis/type III secretory pathway M-ring protein FliF/YscJ